PGAGGAPMLVIVIVTGDATATTGMNCGFNGSQNSMEFFAFTRKSMWLRFVPVGKYRRNTNTPIAPRVISVSCRFSVLARVILDRMNRIHKMAKRCGTL